MVHIEAKISTLLSSFESVASVLLEEAATCLNLRKDLALEDKQPRIGLLDSNHSELIPFTLQRSSTQLNPPRRLRASTMLSALRRPILSSDVSSSTLA